MFFDKMAFINNRITDIEYFLTQVEVVQVVILWVRKFLNVTYSLLTTFHMENIRCFHFSSSWHCMKFKCKLGRAFFNLFFCVVLACSALFEKWNVLFSTKNSKKTCCLGGCSVLNALNLEKWGVQIHTCALLLELLALFWVYRTHALLF